MPPGAHWQHDGLAAWLGDCLQTMRQWPDELVDLIVTSPPYFIGKEYETGWTWEEYSELLSGVYHEAFRLLQPGRYFVINFGELHNSKNRMYKSEVPSVFPAAVPHWQWGRDAGFDLQATRIWRKHFARCGVSFVVNWRPRNVFDYEHIWTWRKPGCEGKEWCADRRLSQRGVLGETWGSPARLDRHCAAFPLELPTWAIKVHSREPGEIVLDPFGGSLTTVLAAHNEGRRGWALELDPDYLDTGIARLEKALPNLPPPDDE